MGFEKNQLIESLRNRTQNEVTVAYYLLLDNRYRVNSAYLGAEFQEIMEYDYSRPQSHDNSVLGIQRMPGYMNHHGINLRPHYPDEKKWALGLQSRAHPREIMTEVLKALQELKVCWKRIGHYNMKCRWFPLYYQAEDTVNFSQHGYLGFNNDSAIVESDDVAMRSLNVVKFEVQLYKTREEKYLLDLQRVSGPQLLFLDLCALFLAQLRVL